MDRIADAILNFIDTPWAYVLLFAHSFMESSFLPGAHDFILVAASLIKPQMAFIFAITSTIGSVCGASTAYFFGLKLGHPAIEKIFSKKIVMKIEKAYDQFGLWAIAVAGFTPLPFKVFALTSGLFEIKYIPFLIVAFFARACRFFVVSTIVYFAGDHAKEILMNNTQL